MCNLEEAGGNISIFYRWLREGAKIKKLKGRACTCAKKSKSLYEKFRKGSKFLFGAGNGI